MQRSPVRDLIVGLFVLVGLAAIAVLSMRIGGLSFGGAPALVLYAGFDQIGGLKPRAPVVISGVRVGQVGAIELDSSYRARARIEIYEKVDLPSDTSASIMTSGLLGDQYVSLQLGGEDSKLKTGDEIEFTESAVIMERLIGQFIHNTNVEKKE